MENAQLEERSPQRLAWGAGGRARRPWLARVVPGEDRLAKAILAVATLGIGVAGYLTFIHYAGIEPICSASAGCEKVQASDYSTLLGVPVAVLGLASYVVIAASALLRSDAGKVIGATVALSGFAFSGYLTYRELFSIHAICQWCVASAILMTALAVLTTVRALRL